MRERRVASEESLVRLNVPYSALCNDPTEMNPMLSEETIPGKGFLKYTTHKVSMNYWLIISDWLVNPGPGPVFVDELLCLV